MEKLKAFLIEYKFEVFLVFIVAIVAICAVDIYTNLNNQVRDYKNHIEGYSLERQRNMSENERLTFNQMKQGLVQERGKATTQETVRVQYVAGQQPNTVFREVQYVARGGESTVMSPKLQTQIQEKADETKIIEEEKEVNVYKINRNKAHKIKAGVTYVDNQGYLNVGYQAGKVEGIAHIGNGGFAGATVMYTLAEW